jgi:Ca2+-transporting ATPase
LSETPPNTPAWHTLTVGEVLSTLRVDSQQGLSGERVRTARERHGGNEIRTGVSRGPGRILLGQFSDFMIIVLIVAAVVSGIIGDPPDAVAILVIVLLNAAIGAVQEYRAEHAVAALRELAAPHARVRREGHIRTVPATDVVPGDILLLEAGGIVAADLRLLETVDLRLNEAALTGESEAVGKTTEALTEANLPVTDRRNLAYKGTLVAGGRGAGVVVATGMDTELGRIATLLHKDEIPRTPLQRRLTRFGQRLALAVLVICAIIFGAGLLRGEPVILMFLTAVTLAVAAIPEALPAVVTISLAFGARTMSRRHALIRRLPAVETLGSVTTICADKTGTLTENRMRVDLVFADDVRADALPEAATADQPWRLLGMAMALNNDVHPQPGDGTVGDPTEIPLYEAASTAGFAKEALGKTLPRLGELPFDAERKCMTTLHRDGDAIIAFVKGAPEEILTRCVNRFTAGGTADLDAPGLLAEAERLAAEGYRVLAYAARSLTGAAEPPDPRTVERELGFLGLVALIDPPRTGAHEAVAQCRSAGITPVMITGDHPGTARAIARRVGIAQQADRVLTGRELERLSAEELQARVAHTRVFARVNPEQKIRIVQSLQMRGEFVAMTGDGVNDAPALKRAEIGIAMGLKGTDVAREAADMVLLDDNFATIVAAVAEGRRIFDNIRKFVKYTMTSNAGEIWTLFLAPFLGLPLPLLPIHILWINLVTDGLPGLALTAEPAARDLMTRPPRRPGESLFAHGMWQHMIWVGVLIGGLSIGAQAWAYYSGDAHWQTMVFTVLTFAQLVHVLVIRSERESLFTLGLRSNLPLLGAITLTVALQLAVIYLPHLQSVFRTSPLDGFELLMCFVFAGVVFFAVEAEKWLVRRGWLYASRARPER